MVEDNNMRKFIYIVCLFFLIVGCKKSNKEKEMFESIDFSYYNGWDEYSSIKINKKGATYLCIENYKKGKSYYENTIAKEKVDTLCNLIKQTNFTHLDSTYKANCIDCGYYLLIIKYNDIETKTFVEDINNKEISIKNINAVAKYIVSIITESKEKMVDVYQFESKTKDFQPIPPPPIKVEK